MSVTSAAAEVRAALAALEQACMALRREVSNSAATHPTVWLSCQVVMDEWHVGELELLGPSRVQPLCFARQVAMVLCLETGEMTTVQIAGAFGGRDHGTVIHARQVVSDRCAQAKTREAVGRARAEFVRRNKQQTKGTK